MILALRTNSVRLSAPLEQEIRQRLSALNQLQPVSIARVALHHSRDDYPPFCAAVHLAVAGPDLRALARGHTLQAALLKAERSLRDQITLRQARRQQNLKNRRKVRPVPAHGR